VPYIGMCVHLRFVFGGLVKMAGLSHGLCRSGCQDVTCGCLSSVEDGVETAGVSVGGRGCEVIFYCCLFSVEGGAEAAGVCGGDRL
jgi:hypothetical protein